jgi:Tol biopolymer transport system component
VELEQSLLAATWSYRSVGSRDPAWPPDGRKIAFVRNFEIYVMNATAAGKRT